MIRAARRDRGRRDEGAVAILTAILLVVLIGFAAMTVDTGLLFQVRNELQNAADSAALAGAQMLNGEAEGIANAEAEVKEFAAKHFADNKQLLSIADEELEIEFGRWYFTDNTENPCDAPCFFKLDNPTENPATVNSIRVRAFRSANNSANAPVRHFFAQFLGRGQSNVDTVAVAVGGGPFRSECAFPMVVPDCVINPNLEECDYCMQFQSNGDDNAGWTTFDTGGVGTPKITDLVRAACYNESGELAIDPDTNECQGLCGTTATVDQTIDVTNGNNMNTGKQNFCPLIQDILRRDDPSNPQKFVVRVPVLESTGESCDAAQFSGHKEIAGFATMEILGAKCGSGDDEVKVEGEATCPPPPSDKYVVARLRCDLGTKDQAGGGFFGTDTPRVRLVH